MATCQKDKVMLLYSYRVLCRQRKQSLKVQLQDNLHLLISLSSSQLQKGQEDCLFFNLALLFCAILISICIFFNFFQRAHQNVQYRVENCFIRKVPFLKDNLQFCLSIGSGQIIQQISCKYKLNNFLTFLCCQTFF